MVPEDKQFAKISEFTKSVSNRLANDPNYKGAEPDNKPIKPLFVVEEDEFGGNENNRRVAKRETAERAVVKGEATEADLKQTLKANNVEVEKEQAKESAPKTADDKYETFTPNGTPIWKPNS